MATHFFFNSKKEVGKKMPPRKLMPQAVPCAPQHWRGQKNSRHKDAAQTPFALIRQCLRCSASIHGTKVNSKQPNLNLSRTGFEVAFDFGSLSTV
jgi:hypothetical protein